MRTGVVFVLVFIGLTASACLNSRISEGQADEIKQRNAEVAASLPVFADSRLIGERQATCEGAFQREDSAACPLRLTYETGRPLVEVLEFYQSFLASEGWKKTSAETHQTRIFKDAGMRVQVHVGIPYGSCPDPFIEQDVARACEETWIANQGGEFAIKIYPD